MEETKEFIKLTVERKDKSISTHTTLYDSRAFAIVQKLKHKKRWIGGTLLKAVIYNGKESTEVLSNIKINYIDSLN